MNKFVHSLRGALIAAALILVPGVTQASSESRARAAIAEARTELEASARAGAMVNAADVQARAMAALQRAKHHLAKGNERRAFYAAREAEALAGLSAATATYRGQTGSN